MAETRYAAIHAWFDKHRLPWTDAIVKYLDDLGLETIEDLKLLGVEQRKKLFEGEKFIVKQRANLAFENLNRDEFVFKQSSPDIPLADAPPPAPTGNSKRSHAINDNNSAPPLFDGKKMMFKGFTFVKGKTAEEKKQEREERQRKKAEAAKGTIVVIDDAAPAITTNPGGRPPLYPLFGGSEKGSESSKR